MDFATLPVNDRVDLMREVSLSFKDENGDWSEVFIPDNDMGIERGYYSMRGLLYFLADMFEE